MAIEDIIPEILRNMDSGLEANSHKKKKKIDKIAMASPIMRIPRMDVRVARDLIDIGIKELYELQGRAPETLFEEILKLRSNTPIWRLSYIRMAVYFAENEVCEPQMLNPQYWD